MQFAASVAPATLEYVPARQLVQVTLPVLILYLPATQAEQTSPFGPVNPALQVQSPAAELALYEIEFEGHARHVPSTIACVLVEYVPAPQSVHAALPVLVLYLPATQAMHEPSGPVYPALQGKLALIQAVAPVPEVDPAGHAMQFAASVAPATPEYVPATQFTHTVEELAPATPEYVPAAQFTHTVEELAPTVVEYVPATQLVHMLAPATLEYVEAGHMVHANEPTTLLAPATLEYVEAGHRVHANEPTMFLKLPAAHAVHVPPSEPVYPKLHLQAASAELVLGEVELPGHVRQVVAATIPEYVPAAQSVHAALPVVVLY